MIDLEYAKEQFEAYLSRYDQENDKIRLKAIHTYGVMECSRQIATRMRLSEEDIKLAQLIGLLHDIGRFEQIRLFDSFEPGTMDHAAFGVQMLFEEGMIRTFIEKQGWDDIIRISILRHGDYELKNIQDDRTMLHARLIRDADKLDNCRVKLCDDVETITGVSAEQLGKERISEDVKAQFFRRKSILSSARKTPMDYWVSYMAYFFDINYRETLDIIKENNYVARIAARVPYTNRDTEETMRRMVEYLVRYIEEIIRGDTLF